MALSSSVAVASASTVCTEARISDEVLELVAIYEPDVNLAIWRGALQQCLGRKELWQLHNSLCALLTQQPGFRLGMMLPPEELLATLPSLLESSWPAELPGRSSLQEYLLTSVELFAGLFEPEAMALRLQSLRTAMCPRFHVDHVPVRLVSTLLGPATEWLPEYAVEREALGASAQEPCRDANAIQRMNSGDLALLKGEGWIGNQGAALVHRSPAVAGEPRLFLSIDFAKL